MNQQDILNKLSDLKGNIQHLLSKGHRNERITVEDEDENGADNYVDDMPLTILHEEGPGVSYNFTENSEFANGAKKEMAHGIDRFGDEGDVEIILDDHFQNDGMRN